MTRIIICGGYGTFGRRAVERLGRDDDLTLIIAGRDIERARAVVAELQPRLKARLQAAHVDAAVPDRTALAALQPRVIYNASGPFQTQSDYALARAAMAIGAHYVDLADARAYVANFDCLDADARAAGVTAIAGASSVPGLSSAVIEHYLPQFSRLTGITYGIVPANGFDPGMATTASILSYVGRPFDTLKAGRMQPVHGWQGLWSYNFPGLGSRWLGHCDVPDLALLPRRYGTLREVAFYAGMEVPAMHFGLWGLSWLARLGIVRAPQRLARPLLRLKRAMSGFGSDAGGMFMMMRGVGHAGQAMAVDWHVIARSNDGPFIPQVPATILARSLARDGQAEAGAFACVGLMTLDSFKAEVADLAISFSDDIASGDLDSPGGRP